MLNSMRMRNRGNLAQRPLWVVGLLLLLLIANPTWAHPHAWIDVEIQLLWNEQGRITGFTQQWLFDSAVSAYFLGEDESDSVRHAQPHHELHQLEDDLRANAAIKPIVERLGSFNFFTGIRLNEESYKLPGVDEMQGFVEPDTGRLGMRFLVPFSQPIDPARDLFKLAVFDPTYYTAMIYKKEHISQARPSGMQNNSDCAAELVLPNPDPEFVAYVTALPPTVNNDDTIGDAFAVWLEVRCNPT